jgi:biopolymer transport protein ExbB/TolQ
VKSFKQSYLEFLTGTDSLAVIATALFLALMAAGLGFCVATILLKLR